MDSTIQEVAFREVRRRLAKLEAIERALEAADNQDWDFLLSKLGDGGRERFWKTTIADLRNALV